MECADCLKNPPNYHQARAPLVYNDASRLIILKFKHSDQMQLYKSFMPWVIRSGREMIERSEIIIPVPLHRFRLLKRRYNQSAIMAKYISEQTDVAWTYNALIRNVATKTQGKMNFKDRRKNVSQAFQVPEKQRYMIEGKKVLLVDDVLTTGATINECTKTLLNADAAEVNILTIAKVVKR